MAAILPPPPPPPDPSVQRFDAHGNATLAQGEYERRLYEFLKALAAAVSAG